jgi:hypothetical protein
MRTLIVALAIASLTTPALAQDVSPGMSQGMSRGGKHRGGGASTTAQPQNKANEKDYKAALDRVPASNQKFDPWQTMRPGDAKH